MQAGLAGVHGNVSSFGSANGISVVALADFGKPGVGGVDGSSGATGKSSSGGSASINNDEDEIEDDDLLALLEGDEDAERSPKNTDKSDMYGKTLKTAVARVQNSGSVSGSITARAQQLKRPLNKNSYTPQFYDVSLITSGIISGNHAAILAKGRVDDSQSIREPKLEPGYETGKIKNYGLMAGQMIAGSYRAGIGNLLSREQNFDHFDSSAATNDPLENYGSKIYLKAGIRRVAEYNTPTERSDDYEHIDRIVNGAGGTHRINGQTYTITNGTLDASGTDSEHHASGTLRNHIVNGAGVARGALVADGKLNLSGSTVNGYANALYLGANSDVTA